MPPEWRLCLGTENSGPFPLPSTSDLSFKGWLAEPEQWLQQLLGGRRFPKMKGWGCDLRKEMGRNIPAGERMENVTLPFAE